MNSKLRLLLPLWVLGAAATFPANQLLAAPMSPGDMERLWDALQAAPLHLQAEVISPAMGRFAGAWTTCTSEAVVRTSFKGADLLPVGAHFRLASLCSGGTWYMTGRSAKDAAPQSDLAPGTLVEVILVPFVSPDMIQLGTDVFYTQSNFMGIERISAISASPKIDPSAKPAWYHEENKKFGGGEVTWQPPRPEVPPRFPRQDVEVSYTVSSRPGEVFLARYDAMMGRVEIEPSGKPPGAAGKLVLDPVLNLTIRIFDARRHFSIRSGSERAVLIGNAAPQGVDQVAGIQCGRYHMTWTTWESREGKARSSDVCVTHDGVVLRRIENGITTTVTSVSYHPTDSAATQVPVSYSRVPAEDDTKLVPRPPPTD